MWKSILQFVFTLILAITGIVLISSYEATSKEFVAGNTILGGVVASIVNPICSCIVNWKFRESAETLNL